MTDIRQERKVVTVLFADLVGFTARAETLDPEDVAAVLRPYHERLRSELERFGGTVEKFIGDAVMALFGAPVAHEDDPERAVRAALAIRDWAREDGEVQVRIAVNTGEALINLGARPESGEGMAAGDVVNTTARLQAAAPVNGALVGETTYRATQTVVVYGAARTVEAKGKTEALHVWEALEARSRVETETVSTRVPLIGRERELDQLTDALTRARRERTPQLATVVGVPGIGKSRIVAELFAVVDADPEEIVFWRHGRSLPYGEGVTFWAVAEMVKAQAGILETDDAGDAAKKLSASVSELVDESESEWLESKLRPLIGLASESELIGDRRSESFAAWRRFFEALADKRPLVLVFEDMHWADDDLIEFVDELADWAEGVPLLILCTARPELLDRRPGWGGGKRNAVTVSLAPLGDDETARLISQLLERSVLPAEAQSALLARAGGNPLYAEQFVRMFAERGMDVELPETVQGIIAARLDALPTDEKVLVQDASVLGKVFWTGALASIGGVPAADLDERLRTLARKEFIRRARRSSVAGESQYEFGHVLVRDVAYGQIPRADRAARHRSAAEWIEALSPDRSDDRADMLAHHYLSALELATAAGLDTADLNAPARAALRDAGDRAFALGAFRAAARTYDAALALWPEDDPVRPVLVVRREQARFDAGDLPDVDALAGARESLVAAGDVENAAAADLILASMNWYRGQGEEAAAHCERALELLRDVEASPSKAFALAERSRQLMVGGDNERAVDLGEEGLAMSERLGLDRLRASVLVTLGAARMNIHGAKAGQDELRRGLELALVLNDSGSVQRAYNNIGEGRWIAMETDALVPLYGEARRFAERFANAWALRWIDAQTAVAHLYLGHWDEAGRITRRYLESLGGESDYLESQVRLLDAHILFGRGEVESALAESARATALARAVQDRQAVGPALSQAAVVLALLGRRDEALTLVDETLALGWVYYSWIVDLALACVLLDKEEAFREIAMTAADSPWVVVSTAVANRDFARAAELLDVLPTEAALVRLVGAELLTPAEAQPLILEALKFYETVNAAGFAARARGLMAESA